MHHHKSHHCCPDAEQWHQEHQCGMSEGHEEEGEQCPEEELFWMAKKAWKKLMIEKMKEQFDELQGKQLTELARLVAETKSEKWKLKVSMHQKKETFKERFGQMMAAGCNAK